MAAQKGCRYQRQFGVLISVLSAVISLWLLSFNMVDAALISKPPANLGLVGYWSMNENTGTVASDFSGNGNRGILTNGPTWVDGKRGKALNFDGVNDYVGVSDQSIFSPSVNPITVSAWVKLPGDAGGGASGGAGKYIVSKGAASNWEWAIEYDGGDIFLDAWLLGGTEHMIALYTGLRGDSNWRHIAITLQASVKAELFVDGISRSSDTTPSSSMGNGTATVRVGARGDGNYFNGLIDEVRVYNRVLSAVEVSALYKSGAAKIKFPAVTRTGLTSGSEQPPTPPQSSWTTASITPSPNKLVLLAVGTFGSAMTVTSVTGNGLTWVKVGEVTNSGTITLFRAMGPAPTAGAVTITATANRAAWSVVEYGGVDTSGTNGSGAIVQSATGSNGYASSLTVTLAKFASATNAAYGATMFDNDSSVGVYPGSGFSTIHQPSSFSGAIQTEDKFSEDTTVDWTYGINVYNAGIAAEIKAKPKTSKINASQNSKITNGLVGMWSFNGPDLTTTTAYDRSGQGNNGTLTNGPVPAAGKIGQALNFDGVNDYINVGSGSSLDNLGPMTASAWIYAKSSGEGGLTGRIFDKCMTGGSNNCWIFYQTTGGVGGLTFYVDGSTILRRISSNGVIQYNKWHHVLVTWDGVITTAASVHIYVDGNEVTYTTTTNGASRTSDAIESLIIGNTIDSNRTWDGLIDEVRIYNRALSPDEVKRLYNMGR